MKTAGLSESISAARLCVDLRWAEEIAEQLRASNTINNNFEIIIESRRTVELTRRREINLSESYQLTASAILPPLASNDLFGVASGFHI